jgi:hypothetical protein
MIQRHLEKQLLRALGDTPVTLLVGARQVGKSTLCQAIARRQHPARYVTLDDPTFYAAARSDPSGLVASLEGPVVLDEIQRCPELFGALKVDVDRERRPGRYLLTGSANVLLLPRVSESLAGRMEVLTLWPLSQGEIENRPEGFLDRVFGRTLSAGPASGISRADVFSRVLRGGYPEAVQRKDPARRRAWFRSYLITLLQRDVRELAQIEGLTALPRLLSLLATRAAAPLNYADLARAAGLPATTLKRYLALFETLFLVRPVPAWSTNLSKRLIKTARLVFVDTGLLAQLTGATGDRLQADPSQAGPLLENFVTMEMVKQASWSRHHPQVLHFRTHAGQEVDLVLEADDGRVVGIEVKAAGSVGTGDFRGIQALREAAGKRFHRGIVLYQGRETVPFGKDQWAMPLDALWM